MLNAGCQAGGDGPGRHHSPAARMDSWASEVMESLLVFVPHGHRNKHQALVGLTQQVYPIAVLEARPEGKNGEVGTARSLRGSRAGTFLGLHT